MPLRKPEKKLSVTQKHPGSARDHHLPSLAHGYTTSEWHGMVHHRFPVLRELALRHVPRRDVLIRFLVNLRIQMYSPRRAHDLVSLVERVSTQLGPPHDRPDGHDRSSKTKGLLDRRAHQWEVYLVDEVNGILARV